MRKSFALFLLYIITAVPLYSQNKEKIAGTWLMTHAGTPDGKKDIWLTLSLSPDGKLLFMGGEVGTWSYDEKKHLLSYHSEFPGKLFNGDRQVEKITDHEMIVKMGDYRLFHARLDTVKIAHDNEHSPLRGSWKIDNDEGALTVLKFNLPDEFIWVRTDGGETDTYRGNWIWRPTKKEVILISLKKEMQGPRGVTTGDDRLTLTTPDGRVLTARKEQDNTTGEIEHLTFTYEEFPEESNTDDLPYSWQELQEMADYLDNIKEVHYRYGTLIPDLDRLRFNTLIERLQVDVEKPSVRFTNLMAENGDTSQVSEKYRGGLTGRYDLFFPAEEPGPFRVKGKEQITVPAGTFVCTVVEGFDGDTKVKYWMINDKPGIFARIIREGEDPFGKTEYTLQELTEIR